MLVVERLVAVTDLAALALASMLTLAEPGVTDGSRIELDDAPMAELAHLEPPGFVFIRARWVSWSRRETAAEGMDRWATIAHAVARVCSSPPPAWKPRWGSLACARGLVTIARHESAYWRSVHEGRLRGPAGEVCLVQLHPAVLRSFGLDPEKMVGLDEASTERCLRVGVELLGLARGLVEQHETVPSHWFGPSVATYGSGVLGGSLEAKWVTDRIATFAKTARRKPLTFRAMLALEGT